MFIFASSAAPQADFKNIILNELGYEECKQGCPLCEVYFDKMCIFGQCSFINRSCLKYGYSEWAELVTENHISFKKLASKFYQELKKKCKEYLKGELKMTQEKNCVDNGTYNKTSNEGDHDGAEIARVLLDIKTHKEAESILSREYNMQEYRNPFPILRMEKEKQEP